MNKNRSYAIFEIFNYIILGFVVLVTLYPFLYMLATSLSSAKEVLAGNVTFYPIEFSLKAYEHIMSQDTFWLGYKNTIIYTVFGTIISLILSIMCAYPLSKKNLVGSGLFLKLIVFTMFFSGGLIPFYLLIVKLKMVNTIWAIVVPNAISAYNVLVMKTFFQGIPSSLEDAAEIDGLNQIGVLTRIIIPLSKPILATMTLFIAVFLWNDWFMALILLNDNKLYPVTLFLRNIVMGSIMAAKSGETINATAAQSLPQTLQAATIMLVTVPILLVYPFIQKYFVKGVMIGSIKG